MSAVGFALDIAGRCAESDLCLSFLGFRWCWFAFGAVRCAIACRCREALRHISYVQARWHRSSLICCAHVFFVLDGVRGCSRLLMLALQVCAVGCVLFGGYVPSYVPGYGPDICAVVCAAQLIMSPINNEPN